MGSGLVVLAAPPMLANGTARAIITVPAMKTYELRTSTTHPLSYAAKDLTRHKQPTGCVKFLCA